MRRLDNACQWGLCAPEIAARVLLEGIRETIAKMHESQQTVLLALGQTHEGRRRVATILADSFLRSGLISLSPSLLTNAMSQDDLAFCVWQMLSGYDEASLVQNLTTRLAKRTEYRAYAKQYDVSCLPAAYRPLGRRAQGRRSASGT